ncbi:Reverse transcriptase (RNA-dependent DNA polymerase) [Fragilaria crotonensis]|nr:Reverse transcriptase (RNA-dependent DNA polymerase) [Fragilaria crotonensis]
MAEKLVELGFQSTLADPDVWLRAATKNDGESYYEYVLMYVDDILAISCNAEAIMNDVQTTFKFKNDKVQLPEFYLGAKLQEKFLNGKSVGRCRAMIMLKLLSRMYRRQLRYQANPREGHMEQLLHVFGYLNRHAKVTIYLSPELPVIDYGDFRTRKEDFAEIYRDAEEAMPHRMPVPRGRSVTTTAYVDASHGANKVTRRSHTGYILFLNRAPIVWYSKKQQTVETSAFSAEFIAMKACLEAIEHLRFKLRCFGVPMPKGEPTHVFCDNESVVKNTSNVESTLNKKHSSVAYHFCRWSAAAGLFPLRT